MITKDQFQELGVAISNELIGNSALEWLLANTTLNIDLENFETIKALPCSAKLFITKYDEIMGSSSIVASESIEGLSQSFNSTDKSTLLWQAATQLLQGYLKSRIKFYTAKRRWD